MPKGQSQKPDPWAGQEWGAFFVLGHFLPGTQLLVEDWGSIGTGLAHWEPQGHESDSVKVKTPPHGKEKMHTVQKLKHPLG